jgi:hypothetical protein
VSRFDENLRSVAATNLLEYETVVLEKIMKLYRCGKLHDCKPSDTWKIRRLPHVIIWCFHFAKFIPRGSFFLNDTVEFLACNIAAVGFLEG